MPRLRLALLAAFLFAASPTFAQSAKERVASARKAERSKDWKKAAQEWMAAYQVGNDPENLLNAGDAYAKAGDKAAARNAYTQYMNDPLALDTSKAKAKLASLDGGGADPLALDLGAPAAAPKAAGADPLALDLAAPAPAPAKEKKGRKGKKGGGELGLDLAAAAPAKPASDGLSLDLGAPAPKKPAAEGLSLELGVPDAKPAEKKKEPAKASGSELSLDLGGPAPTAPAKADKKAPAKGGDVLALDIGVGPAPKTEPAKPTGDKVATNTATRPTPTGPAVPAVGNAQKDTNRTVAVTTRPSTPKTPPSEAVVASPLEKRTVASSGGGQRVMAYVTGGIAAVSLVAGGLYYKQASQDSSDLRAQVREGRQQTALLEQQKQHKTLSFAGLAAGLVTAGVSAALFAF